MSLLFLKSTPHVLCQFVFNFKTHNSKKNFIAKICHFKTHIIVIDAIDN